MGCTSSTEIQTDPYTGKETKKKRLGGAYPGQRRPQHQPYTPPEGAFADGSNSATAHFVAYGGGNALTLARPDGSAVPPSTGGPQKEYIQVTLPEGVKAGDTIHVQAPSGKTNAIVVPSGFGPGSTFTVEFADETPAPTKTDTNATTNNNSNAIPPPANSAQNLPDDGFATGFGNPHWQPTTATAVQEPEVSAQSYNGGGGPYPSATATPVCVAQPTFAPPPSYPSK